MALPNLIIAGVNKAGTTSMHNYLSAHPDVCGADVKETFFWNRVEDWNNVRLDDYLKHFNHQGEKIILESTPRYFHDIAGNLKYLDQYLGTDLKIILLLRDPVKRLHSFYKYKKRGLEIPDGESFAEYVDKCLEQGVRLNKSVYNGLVDGLYFEDLVTWKDHFGARMTIHFSDDLKNSKSMMMSISERLGIASGFYESFEFTRDNESVDFKNPQLQSIGISVFRRFQGFWNRSPKLKRWLTSFYHAINGKPFDSDISTETEQKLKQYYQQDLSQVKGLLRHSGEKLPVWLEDQ
ncbi:MAG: hypothetical protein HOH53_11040 [Flavobacteriales bacterium]|jgi:hypothetical protein|nr:hypothetical protein [Flavobacteriales bacterium]